MAKLIDPVPMDNDGRLVEEEFLVLTQCQIQKLLHDKKVRYRDLSKRLGVSEARVSQMFGDEASNLTIRTIARIFHNLDEVPVLISQSELDAIKAGRTNYESDEPAWQVSAQVVQKMDMPQVEIVEVVDSVTPFRTPRLREWVAADTRLARRA